MINLKNVSKIYPSKIIGVKNIDLHIKPKEFVVVVGQSGTGKTTLAKLMIAQERPTKGTIEIGGWDITNIKNREIPILRRQVGVVFQDLYLLEKKTIFENIAYALEVCGSSRDFIKKIVPQVVKLVGLEHTLNRYPKQLSGGERQRIVIARALVHRPKVLIADEPTGNLDIINTAEVINILEKVNEFGTTVVLITHDREIVNGLHKRVITLEDGQIISDQKKGKYLL